MTTTEPNPEKIEFATILASTVHDMKNSLGLLLNTLDEVVGHCVPEQCPSYNQFSKLQYEAKRVNNDLIQLLALYKMGNAQYAPNIAYHSLPEFLEETVLQNKPLFDFNGINIEMDCPDDLYWFFDRELVAGVINNVMNNAFRYTSRRLKIGARDEDGYLVLTVEDDGRGYPQSMLETYGEPRREISFVTGSTGLGLYFAAMAARLHKNESREGYILMQNGGELGGGVFSVHLP
jgi:signal transduction histidine kinase